MASHERVLTENSYVEICYKIISNLLAGAPIKADR